MGKYLTAFMAALLLLAGFLYLDAKKKAKAAEGLAIGLQKNLKITTNELGQKTTMVNDLKIVRDELLGITGIQEKQLLRLQEVVKRNKQATGAVVFSALTEGKASGATTEIKYVTVAETDTVHAEYSGHIETDDLEASITATKDSVWLNSYRIYNDFEVVQTTVKDSSGWFKPRISVVQVKALNKASTVTDMRSWSKPLPRQFTGLKIIGGVGVGFTAAVLIFKGF